MRRNKITLNNLLSVDGLNQKTIETIFSLAKQYADQSRHRTIKRVLMGKVITFLFYEPSSRTYSSFVSAAQYLGAGIIPIHGVSNTSVAKGETLEDTIKVFSALSDCIVLRHNETGAAKRAQEVSSVPIINAGDGVGEHPTQALLDTFTIQSRFSFDKPLHIMLVGDLQHGRTVHSLVKLLSMYPRIRFTFVSPKQSTMPDEICRIVSQKRIRYEEKNSLQDSISEADVLYMTRVQKERMDKVLYEKIKNTFILTPELVSQMKKNALIMHPLPRINEIPISIDSDPRSVYFSEQIRNGLYIRMALLTLILTK
jgi:aspartate carbamoyltransferase